MICIKFDWNWPAGSGEDFFPILTQVNMVLPIVAPSDPWGPWCEQFWIYIISGSLYVNMTYSGSVVLRKWFLNDPTPFLNFCNYLSLEEDLALHLYSFDFLLPKNDLHQVWLKLASWFWRTRFLKLLSVFLLFCYYLPLGKGVPIHLNNLESLPLRIICTKSGQIW
jgi:hypothetical protein